MKSLAVHSSRIAAMALVLALSLFVAAPVPPAYAATDAGSLVVAQAASSEGVASNAASASFKGAKVTTRVQTDGKRWSGKYADAAVAGDVNGPALTALSLNLKIPAGLAGHVSYRVYASGGWQDKAKDGAETPAVSAFEGFKVQLAGRMSRHYDVLYRAYASGSGWSNWAKNGEPTDFIGSGQQVVAVQVRLSPKTEDAKGLSHSAQGVFYQAHMTASGWQAWKRDGTTAGRASYGINGLAMKLDTGGVKGHVSYCVFNSAGKSGWVSSEALASVDGNRLEGLKVKLTGQMKQQYDVYYRVYVKKAGWLGWARNGQLAGSTGFDARFEAFEVQLVPKGAVAPGSTANRTINQLEQGARLDGIDVSSWQAGIDMHAVPGDFAIVKATQGNWYTNPYFEEQANSALNSGKLLGTYHFADLQGSAIKQADYYVKTVKPYLGKCVLVLDWEADALELGPVWAEIFMDRVYQRTGVRPLIYLSQSVTWSYDWSAVSGKYRLWLAQYLYANMNTGYLDDPSHWEIGYWGTAAMYQYSSTGKLSGYSADLDLNKFYGGMYSWRLMCLKS